MDRYTRKEQEMLTKSYMGDLESISTIYHNKEMEAPKKRGDPETAKKRKKD